MAPMTKGFWSWKSYIHFCCYRAACLRSLLCLWMSFAWRYARPMFWVKPWSLMLWIAVPNSFRFLSVVDTKEAESFASEERGETEPPDRVVMWPSFWYYCFGFMSIIWFGFVEFLTLCLPMRYGYCWLMIWNMNFYWSKYLGEYICNPSPTPSLWGGIGSRPTLLFIYAWILSWDEPCSTLLEEEFLMR